MNENVRRTDAKKCSTCKEFKPRDCFWKRNSSPDGLAYICKKCDSTRYMKMKKAFGPKLAAKQKEWRDHNKKRIRDTKRKAKFGLTGEQVDQMRLACNYCCEICGIHESKLSSRGLVIDHDHTTNKIRGLLCDKCNRGLGLLGDIAKTLEKAFNYTIKVSELEDKKPLG